ncbi:MAG: Gfo/Idh/MocA family oxidoreductase [Magnetovibrio sp.]|nr:Gfo/Idh/MocA family oxidoreductase [Magnetovibrio sp.]
MYKVKILGAGSIGNHLSHASRTLGWSVDLCDLDPQALERTKNEIFPGRYGHWDNNIRLFTNDEVPKGEYDMIMVGTPPHTHIELAMEALKEKPQAIFMEKPFCSPDLNGAQGFYDAAEKQNVAVFTGYDNTVGMATEKMTEILTSRALGDIYTLDVEFREFFGELFAAHPWLSGPEDCYLGQKELGGGATSEQSHAMNLWQHFAHATGAGRVSEVQAMMQFVTGDNIDYDEMCLFNIKTENGLCGRVVQDLFTHPTKKWARAQGSKGYVEWRNGYQPGTDAVIEGGHDGDSQEHLFQKTRPDDFIKELTHVEAALKSNPKDSSISIDRGLDTMLVVAAARKSARENITVKINYDAGYTLSALQSV